MVKPTYSLGLSELKANSLYRGMLAEFLGLMFFVYIGAGTVVSTGNLPDGGDLPSARLLTIALAHGFTIAVLVAAMSSLSGGHINPAVTISFAATGHISLVRAVGYVTAQMLGSVIGGVLLYGSLPHHVGLGHHDLGHGVSVGQGFFIEVMMTFALVFTVFATAVDHKGHGTIAPLCIGIVVAVDHMMAVPYTGASMNPARTFGPGLINGTLPHFWLYILAPVIGGLAAAFIYQFVFLGPKVKDDKSQRGGIEEVTSGVVLQRLTELLEKQTATVKEAATVAVQEGPRRRMPPTKQPATKGDFSSVPLNADDEDDDDDHGGNIRSPAWSKS